MNLNILSKTDSSRTVRQTSFPMQDLGKLSIQHEVINGLEARPKFILSKYFYDHRGSELFDLICRLKEYYQTRTEIEILTKNSREIASLAGPHVTLIELGSGSLRKIRILLDSLNEPTCYVPIDISKEYLFNEAEQLRNEYPRLRVFPLCADFTRQLNVPFPPAEGGTRLVFFPGSTIGNFHPSEAETLLTQIAWFILHGQGSLLIGVDLKKDREVVEAAYNDADGITAEFNRNLLVRINRELDANFEVDNFEHHAYYNEKEGRIEMHLISQRDQIVRVGDKTISFTKHEHIHTENSYKYSIEDFSLLANRAGFSVTKCWTDPQSLFGVFLITPVPLKKSR